MTDNLTHKQKAAILALTAGDTVTNAATRANVTRETVYKWMQNSEFTEAIKTGAAESLDALSKRLVCLGDKALMALEDALTNHDTPWNVQVRAADIALTRLLQLRELVDMEERITRLEKAQNDTKKPY